MITFPFGTDAKFTIIPKIGGVDIPREEMIDLRVKIENLNRGVDFEPIWNWSDNGVEIEIKKDKIKIATTYYVVFSWRKPNASYSDGYKDYTGVKYAIGFVTSNCEHEGVAIEMVATPEFKGDKGDPFKFEDFTEEQLEEMSHSVAEELEGKLTENWIKKDF